MIVVVLNFCLSHGMSSFFFDCRLWAAGVLLISLFAALGGDSALAQGGVHGRDGRVVVRSTEFPALSADGKWLAFGWRDDIWIAKSKGGRARRLTQDAGYDSRPQFSPDGRTIAFTSNRDGTYQAYVVPTIGGEPRKVTYHSEGSFTLDWYPDGQSLLVRGVRDAAGHYPYRFFRVDVADLADEAERPAPVLLFEATGREANLAPDGRRLLFTREGMDLYRKGYRGSRAAQIWLGDGLEKAEPRFRRLSPVTLEMGARSPQWQADGKGYFYIGAQAENGVFEVRHVDLASKADRQVTDSDGTFPVVRPRLSRDGSAMVFQRGFDLYRVNVGDREEGENAVEHKIKLWVGDDGAVDTEDEEMRRILSKASNLSFSSDGLEIAFIAGGDLWVMDTVLREPRRVTATPEEENEPVFSADDESIFYIRDAGKTVDIWRAERAVPKNYWWLNQDFKHIQITKDGEEKQDLQPVPGGERISYVRGLGDLWTSKLDGSDARRLIESWNAPASSWSPDGRWLAYSLSDDDFNRDIWIRPVDASHEPFNVSRHPDLDSNPSWSPDGKILAFTGRRVDDETDIYYVWLTRDGEQLDKRERTLREAVEKMKKERKVATTASDPKAAPKPQPEPKNAEPKPEPDTEKSERLAEPAQKPVNAADGEKASAAEKLTPPVVAKQPIVKIDFEGIYERIHRISIPNSTETGLFWSHDSKRVAFTAEVKGSKGTFMVTFPDKLTTPVALSSKAGSFARWIAKNDTILWLVDGKPSTLSKGKLVQYPIRALQTLDHRAYRREAFEQVWRAMRDRYYDGSLNDHDWDAMYQRYVGAASAAPDHRAFDAVVDMLLGELNGSHLGFSMRSWPTPSSGPWKNETAHLGLSFDRYFDGEGLKIETVLTDGPADRVGMKLEPGDIVTHIDRQPVSGEVDLTTILNGRLDRDIYLTVADAGAENAAAKSRVVRLRPVSYTTARRLANDDHIRATRAKVKELSDGKLGYVYVPRMQWNEFVKFEEEIYARGVGCEGLVIDVRDNGGGFTADHLLTVLTPAEHAFTIPRGGGVGYPQDRRVYAIWSKPIVVLCNQNSFSNAEIFAHAIKTLRRGKLVGEATAGGVISTGSMSIMDVGTLRLPTRGWFSLKDGEDMELNGAQPHVLVRNLPGEALAGRDRQVERAVEVLMRDVKAAARKERPKAIKASER